MGLLLRSLDSEMRLAISSGASTDLQAHFVFSLVAKNLLASFAILFAVALVIKVGLWLKQKLLTPTPPSPVAPTLPADPMLQLPVVAPAQQSILASSMDVVIKTATAAKIKDWEQRRSGRLRGFIK